MGVAVMRHARPCMIRNASILLVLLAAGCGGSHIPGGDVEPPGGAHVATFFGRSGGGAAGWSAQYVSVRRAADAFNPDVGWVFELSHVGEVCLAWADAKTLELTIPSTGEVRLELAAVDGISVDLRSSVYSEKIGEQCKGTHLVLGTPHGS